MSLTYNPLDEIENILRLAHIRMDRMGYLPGVSSTPTIDGRDTIVAAGDTATPPVATNEQTASNEIGPRYE